MKIIFNYVIYVFIFSLLYFNSSYVNNKSTDQKIDDIYTISIPKINLHQQFFNYNHNDNDVNKNVFLVKDYNFDSLHGSLILAAHSGNSIISYFKDLYLLNLSDIIIISTDQYEYYYVIKNKYTINKNGKFKYENFDRGIYLITCSQVNKRKQIVFRGKLLKISKKSSFF